MNNLLVTLQSLSGSWCNLLLRSTISGGLVILLVWALCRAWPRLSPSLCSWLWRAAFCKLLLALFWGASVGVPLLPAAFSPRQSLGASSVVKSADNVSLNPGLTPRSTGPVPFGKATSSDTSLNEATGHHEREAFSTTTHHGDIEVAPLGSQGHLDSSNSTNSNPSAHSSNLLMRASQSFICLCWLVGVALLMFRSLVSWRLTKQWRKNSAPINDIHLAATTKQLCAHFHLQHPPSLLSCPTLTTPALTGIFRPAIVLPSQTVPSQEGNWNPELPLMLAHELAHLKRRDLAWNWLLWAGQTLFWFHPLVWLAAREWRLSQEIACDAMAVQATHVRVASYGAMLMKTAITKPRGQEENLFALGVSARYQSLHRRLSAMKYFDSTLESKRVAAVCAALAVLALMPWRLTPRSAAAEDLVAKPGGNATSLSQPILVLQRTFQQKPEVLSTAFSPNGALIASAGGDSKIRLWNASSGQLMQTLSGSPPSHSIWKVDFSKDGQTLVSVGDKIRLWDVASGELRRTLAVASPNPFEKKVYGPGFAVSVALSPQDDVVASTGQFLTVHARDDEPASRAGNDWRQVFQRKFFYGTNVAFTPDGQTLIEAGWNGRLNLWDASALRRGIQKPQSNLPVLQGEPWMYGKANTLAISANGRFLAVGYGTEERRIDSNGSKLPANPNGKVVLWDLTTGHIRRAWRLPQTAVLSLAISSDGNRVASAASDRRIRLWNADTRRLVQSLTEGTRVNNVAFSTDSHFLTSGCADGRIKLWRVATQPDSGQKSPNGNGDVENGDVGKGNSEDSFDLADSGSSQAAYQAQSIKMMTGNMEEGGFRRRDLFLTGAPGKPATLKKAGLILKAHRIVVGIGGKTHNVLSSCAAKAGKVEPVSIKCRVVPTQGGLPLTFEASCAEADFDGKRDIWTLSGGVEGTYQTAKGRTSFKGDTVTVSRLASTVSVTQTTTTQTTTQAGRGR